MRKSAVVFTSYIISLLLCFHFGEAVAAAAALIPLAVAIFKKDQRSVMLFCALAILGGAIAMNASVPKKEILECYYGSTEETCGTVLEISSGNTYVKLENGLTAVCDIKKDGIETGDVIKGEFTFFEITDAKDFPTRLYSAGKGAFLSAKVNVLDIDKRFSLSKLSEKIRDKIGGIFVKYLGDYSGLASGILLGEKSYIPYEYRELLYANGITHILCVSGLHFGIILSIFASVFARTPLPQFVSCLFTAVFAFLYMFVTGFTVSIVRAGLMAIFVLFDFVIGRRTDSLTLLSLAAFLICIFDPLAVIDLSFELSFLATAGIILMTRDVVVPIYLDMPRNRMSKAAFLVVGGLAISLSAISMCLPVIAVYFGKISVMTPIGNLVCAPIAELFLIFTFFVVVLSPLELFAALLSGYVQFLGKVFIEICTLLSGSAFYIELDGKFFVYISSFLIFIPIFASLFGIKRRKEITSLTVLSVILLAVLA